MECNRLFMNALSVIDFSIEQPQFIIMGCALAIHAKREIDIRSQTDEL